MISLLEARSIIAERVPRAAPVSLPLAETLGRVLAEDAAADTDYPDAARSTMDGYALGAGAAAGSYRIRGDIYAEGGPTPPLGEGECARVFTGAAVPEGAERVIPQEYVKVSGDGITVEDVSGDRFIRPAGSEARRGGVVLKAGTVLGAPELSILAQVGVTRPLVIPAPTVLHIATGNELVDPAEKPGPGQIRDTNSTLLRALFARAEIPSFTSRRVPDDPEELARTADTEAALLLLSGGAGAGAHDYGASTLRRLGYTIHFDRVNLRPGKPLTFATRGRQAAFILPGNPLSHFVCFHLGVRLALQAAQGIPGALPLVWMEPGEGAELKADRRETWWPARVAVRDGRLRALPLRWSTSGDLFSLAGTNALVRVTGEPDPSGLVPALLLESSITDSANV